MTTAGAGSEHSTSSTSCSPDFRGGERNANQEFRMMPYAGGCSCGAVHYVLAAAHSRLPVPMPRLPTGYGFRARVGHGVPARGHAHQRPGRRNFTNRRYRCAKAERLLRVLRLAALQQTAVQAGHDRHLCWHARRSIRLQAAGRDLRIARAFLGSSGSGAAQAPEHAALAIAVAALHLPVDIIQLAIRSDSGVGESRLEVAMILLTNPVITTPRPALRPW